MPRPDPMQLAAESTQQVYSEAAWRLRDACEGGNAEELDRAWFAYKQATGKPLDSIRDAHRAKNLDGMISAIDAAYGRRPGVTVADVPKKQGAGAKGAGVKGATNGGVDVGAVEAGKGSVDSSGNGSSAANPANDQ